MKKIYALCLASLLMSYCVYAVEDDQQKASSNPSPQNCWIGRCDKSRAFSETHYQTDSFSATRMWLALKLMGINGNYSISKEGLDNALKVSAYHNDTKKVGILINHGANPTAGMEAAIQGRALETTKLLLQNRAEIQRSHIKALEQCFARCFQDNPSQVEEHLKSYAMCKNIAQQFEKSIPDTNNTLASLVRSVADKRDVYATRAKELSEREQLLKNKITENNKVKADLHLVNDNLEGKLKNFFGTMNEIEKREELERKKNEQMQRQEPWWSKFFK